MSVDRLMPEEGLEPSLPCENGILNPARLPIPPLRLQQGETPAVVRRARRRLRAAREFALGSAHNLAL